MINAPDYRNAFFCALGLHFLLVALLLVDHSSQRPVLQNTAGMELPVVTTSPQAEPVKAVSVDNNEVMQTVEHLKQQRAQQQQAEVNRQKELNRQAEAARTQRIKEQQALAKLKEEANKIAIARKKQIEEEKKRLKELAEQKALEAKRIEELKKQKEKLVQQQALEAKKQALLDSKKAAEKKQMEEAKAKQAREAHERAEQARALAAQQARENAQQQARISGEVDKYKALIVNAIGRNWILPENVDSSLSSQFRIRLAPDGSVLDVALTRSSGDPLLDRSAQTAIFKASPLPVPSDPETFAMFRDISLTVRPEQVRG